MIIDKGEYIVEINESKQSILTPAVGTILTTLMALQEMEVKIFSVCPHYNTKEQLAGYIIICQKHTTREK